MHTQNYFLSVLSLLASWQTIPAAKTNDPTPMSINPKPKCSVLANRRGKTGKSTAKMQMAVMMSIEDRYVVTKGKYIGCSKIEIKII